MRRSPGFGNEAPKVHLHLLVNLSPLECLMVELHNNPTGRGREIMVGAVAGTAGAA